MGTVKEPKKAVLITAILAPDEGLLSRAESLLVAAYGPILDRSRVYPFTFTPYYEQEMGAALVKRFYSFFQLIEMDRLPDIKLTTVGMEQEHARDRAGKPSRAFNIDPGYLGLSKVVLATTKDYDHRLYLGGGIFAEVTLRYSRKEQSFVPQEWTYRDYKTELAITFFNQVRQRYKETLEAAP